MLSFFVYTPVCLSRIVPAIIIKPKMKKAAIPIINGGAKLIVGKLKLYNSKLNDGNLIGGILSNSEGLFSEEGKNIIDPPKIPAMKMKINFHAKGEITGS